MSYILRNLDPLLVARWRAAAEQDSQSQRAILIEALTLWLDSRDTERDWNVTVLHLPPDGELKPV